MKKKIFLLAALLVVIIPSYKVRAGCSTTISVQYVDLEEQYEEAYERYFSEEYDETIPDNSEYITYVMYGDEYTIQNKKIVGLNKIAKYEDYYKELVGKYAIVIYLTPEEVSKFEETLNSTIELYYYDTYIAQITSTTNLKYIFKKITNRPIDGKQITEEVDCNKQYPICNFERSDDGSLNIESSSIIKSIENYIYDSYKIFEKKSNYDYEETDKINSCGVYIIRLYYKKAKQESTDTINITQNKTIKMKSYFKDLKNTTTTISYRVLDTSIAKVDSEGNIKPLKVGETEIIATANGVEYILHLRVTQDMITNPDTASPIIMILCVIGILISGTTIYLKDQTN